MAYMAKTEGRITSKENPTFDTDKIYDSFLLEVGGDVNIQLVHDAAPSVMTLTAGTYAMPFRKIATSSTTLLATQIWAMRENSKM